MSKNRSDVWNFFTRHDQIVTCSLCMRDFAFCGGTTNMRQHLTRCHADEYDISKYTPPCSVDKAKKIHNLLQGVIAKDSLPPHIVQGQGFQDLLNFLEPGYKITSTFFKDTNYAGADHHQAAGRPTVSNVSSINEHVFEMLPNQESVGIATGGATEGESVYCMPETIRAPLAGQLASAQTLIFRQDGMPPDFIPVSDDQLRLDHLTSIMSSSARIELSLEQKVALLKDSEKLSLRKLSAKHGISKSSAANMIKRKAEYLAAFEANPSPGRKRLGMREDSYAEVDRIAYDWLQNNRALNMPVSGTTLREKALAVATSLGYVGFKASNGWLSCFRQRHNLNSKSAIDNRRASIANTHNIEAGREPQKREAENRRTASSADQEKFNQKQEGLNNEDVNFWATVSEFGILDKLFVDIIKSMHELKSDMTNYAIKPKVAAQMTRIVSELELLPKLKCQVAALRAEREKVKLIHDMHDLQAKLAEAESRESFYKKRMQEFCSASAKSAAPPPKRRRQNQVHEPPRLTEFPCMIEIAEWEDDESTIEADNGDATSQSERRSIDAERNEEKLKSTSNIEKKSDRRKSESKSSASATHSDTGLIVNIKKEICDSPEQAEENSSQSSPNSSSSKTQSAT